MPSWLGRGGPRGTAAGGPVRRKARAQQINTANQRTTLVTARARASTHDRHAARTPPERSAEATEGRRPPRPGRGPQRRHYTTDVSGIKQKDSMHGPPILLRGDNYCMPCDGILRGLGCYGGLDPRSEGLGGFGGARGARGGLQGRLSLHACSLDPLLSSRHALLSSIKHASILFRG